MLAHPLGDEWYDFAQHALNLHFKKNQGYVYVAQSPQYPEVFKVGKTAKSPTVRLQQLNNESVIYAFKLVASYPVHDRHFLERLIHKKLVAQGAVQLKEFFKLDLQAVQRCIQETVKADESLVRRQYFAAAPICPKQ
jgi:hypothetical protein